MYIPNICYYNRRVQGARNTSKSNRKYDRGDEIGLCIGKKEKLLYKCMIIYLYNI